MAPPSTSRQSPLARVLDAVAKVEPNELPAAVCAFFLYFFVLGSYFAVRPVRETVGTILGREFVADLWLYTALFSIAIVPLFGWLVAKFRRSILLPCIYGSVAVILIVVSLYLKVGEAADIPAEQLRADPDYVAVGSFFYVWISVLNLMLISVFWSFLLEMLTGEQVRRLFGIMAAGGTAGALAGPIITRLAVDSVGNDGIMYIGSAGFVMAIVCQRILIAIWKRPQSAFAATADRGLGGNPLAGIRIVAKSPYLVGIALFVVLLSAANTFLYFEQLRIVEEVFPDRTRRTEVFANIDIAVQSLTIITQLFLTGRIAATFGVRTLLTIVPIVMVLGFAVLSFAATFPVLATVFILRRWGEYALVRPGREMLWSKLDTESKYKAKNFVDVPVYRAADYVGAQAKTALDAAGSGPAGAMVVAAVLAGLWAVNGWFLGRKHDEMPRSGLRPAEAPAE
ncbi:MAG: NTP/NDP exchange transporter [Rhodospirillaceae bacterium]